MLTEVSVKKGEILRFRRDNNFKLISSEEKRQLSGGKFHVSFLSDGTVSAGHYDSSGNWSTISPQDANDIFELKGSKKLFSQEVEVGGKCACILQETMERLEDNVGLLTMMESASKLVTVRLD